MVNKFFKRRPFSGLFLLLLISILFSNNPYRPTISSIEIKGNTKTRDYVIKREIIHPLNKPLDSLIVLGDRNRLDNLGLFSESTWRVIPLEDGTAKLVYTVQESIQRTPPLALPNYKEDTGWSLAGLWIINNFRGKNQSLALGGTIGGEDTYGFSFSDPWIFGDHISLTLNIGRTIYEHRFLDKNIDVNSFFLGFGKWYGSSIKTSFGIEIEKKSFTNDQNEDKFFYLGTTGNVKYDTRDIYWNPGKGVLFSQTLYHQEGIQPGDWRMTLWTQSFSWYKKINKREKKQVIALNTSLNKKFGMKSDLWLDYFGNSYTIRGWPLPDPNLYFSKNEQFRFGHESVLLSMEYRQELIPKRATSFGTEFGLAFVFFSDAGIIANQWDDFKGKIPMQGYGFGLRIPFPMVSVIRVDYGWGYRNGVWNSGAIHFGVGQKF